MDGAVGIRGQGYAMKTTGLRLVAFLLVSLLLAGCRLWPLSSPAPAPSPIGEGQPTHGVAGVAFPLQETVDGERSYMQAALVGVLEQTGGCLWVRSLVDQSRVLPIWPPEFSLWADGDRLAVLNREIPMSPAGYGSKHEQIVAVVGQEVAMAGGHSPSVSPSVLEQIPPACRGEYFIVGDPLSVRPNLRERSELYTWERFAEGDRSVLVLRYTPTFAALAAAPVAVSGELVWYSDQRCLQLQTGQGPGPVTLLWPPGWSVRIEDEAAIVVDDAGQAVVRTGDQVALRGRPIPQDWSAELYQRAVQELPFDCCCAFVLVGTVD